MKKKKQKRKCIPTIDQFWNLFTDISMISISKYFMHGKAMKLTYMYMYSGCNLDLENCSRAPKIYTTTDNNIYIT